MTSSEQSGYFLNHSVGNYPEKQQDLERAFGTFAATWSAQDDGQWPFGETIVAQYCHLWERLLGAPQGSAVHADSVTAGVHALVTALPDDVLQGRRVVVPADSFPSLLFLLQGLEQRYGFSLDIVPIRAGAYWVDCDDIAARIDADTGLVVLNWVSSTSSHRANIAGLSAKAHEAGALVGVDLTQGIGVLPFDLVDYSVDFVVASSLKWVGGTPGAAVLCVEPKLADRCTPERRGWFSQDNPFNWDSTRFEYAAGSGRFNLATPTLMGCVGTVPALERVVAGGHQENRQANLAICRTIIEMADRLGQKICSPREEHRRGASVMLALPAGADTSGIVQQLRVENVFADARGNVLRLSPGPTTDGDAVDRLHSGLKKILEGGR